MVRFKNRYLLVEFLTPSNLVPALGKSDSPSPSNPPVRPASSNPADPLDDDEDEIYQPALPFLAPLPEHPGRLSIADESGSAIYKAVRGSVQDVWGDEGWGRVASSFKVIYHSPLTALTMIRIARPHYRLIWGALTLTKQIGGVAVVPRVVGVSGTIKKLQNKGIAYHRQVVGEIIAATLGKEGLELGGVIRREREKQLRVEYENEEEALNALEQ